MKNAIVPLERVFSMNTYLFQLTHDGVREPVNKVNVAKWSVVERAVQANKHGKGSSGLLKTRLSVTRNAPLLVPQISRHETVISLDMILEQL